LDSNQRRLTPTGLQPVTVKSQLSKEQELTTPDKRSVQTRVQTKSKNGRNRALKVPADLAEIAAVWPELPGHIKATIIVLLLSQLKKKTSNKELYL